MKDVNENNHLHKPEHPPLSVTKPQHKTCTTIKWVTVKWLH